MARKRSGSNQSYPPENGTIRYFIDVSEYLTNLEEYAKQRRRVPARLSRAIEDLRAMKVAGMKEFTMAGPLWFSGGGYSTGGMHVYEIMQYLRPKAGQDMAY